MKSVQAGRDLIVDDLAALLLLLGSATVPPPFQQEGCPLSKLLGLYAYTWPIRDILLLLMSCYIYSQSRGIRSSTLRMNGMDETEMSREAVQHMYARL